MTSLELRDLYCEYPRSVTALMLQAGVLGSGLLGGLYFIFSFCVMQALNMQPPASAIATMNAINLVIVTPPFMLIFMGTPLACAWLLLLQYTGRLPDLAWHASANDGARRLN